MIKPITNQMKNSLVTSCQMDFACRRQTVNDFLTTRCYFRSIDRKLSIHMLVGIFSSGGRKLNDKCEREWTEKVNKKSHENGLTTFKNPSSRRASLTCAFYGNDQSVRKNVLSQRLFWLQNEHQIWLKLSNLSANFQFFSPFYMRVRIIEIFHLICCRFALNLNELISN